MLRKVLIPAAIGFSAYFLYEKYLSGQSRDHLFEKMCRKFCRKKDTEAEPIEKEKVSDNVVVANSTLVQEVKVEEHIRQSHNEGELSNAVVVAEEPSSIIEQNKLLQSMFDFIKK